MLKEVDLLKGFDILLKRLIIWLKEVDLLQEFDYLVKRG